MELALKFNLKKLFASREFKHLVDILISKNINIKNFFLSKAYKILCNSKEKFITTKHMRAKINLLTSMQKSPKAFYGEILIRKVILID